MVNTRRMELNGSTQSPRHRTRGSAKLLKHPKDEENASSSSNDSDSEDWASSRRPRRNFSYPGQKYKQLSKTSRTLPSTLVYAHKMRDDSDAYERNNESDEEFYPVRGRRSRHIVRMNTMQRRTALSLRPISQKSYAEMISPHFNSESEEVVIRRSKRKKQKNMSWLADSQMHKVGYPNLDADSSDESSRDAVVDTRNEITITKRTTRRNADPRSVRETKPPQYLYDYEKNIPTRRRIKQIPVVDEESPNVRKQESNDKENRRLSTRPKTQKTDGYVESKESSSSTNMVIPTEKTGETQEKKEDASGDTKQPKQNGKDKDQSDGESSPNKPNQTVDQSSEDEREQEIPLARLRPICKRRRKPSSFFSAKPRNRKDSDSSSTEEEENRRYLLRDRPKQVPQKLQTFYLKTNSRKYKRSRRSSSSDSSSDGKYVSKQPKGQHSKNEKMKSVAAGSTNFDPIKPETLDSSVRFSSIGGLDGHIQCLKEMVLLPMMYPEVFKQFKIKAPKGVLFHGPPGTGKTLLARALANECSFGTRKVSFFQRKGADLLSKWVGESEKQLRMLFEKAAESNPSIIFFDELDGLASARSSRQDQYHTSIVSTFLALMDGLENRGEVIIIGATNRIDNIDPAFRRPGRFDRELFFPLPTRNEREEIINVHTSFWENPPSSKVLAYLAEHTNGYCGSDLRALCSEAVIQSFRRIYPQVYNSEVKLQVDAKNVKVETVDFMRAKSLLVPASERISQGLGQKLYPILKPLLDASLEAAKEMIKHTFPHGLNSSLAKVKLSPNMRPAQLMITANGTNHGQNHLASALLFSMEHVHSYLLGLSVLYQETARGQEETCIKILDEVRKNVPSILYIPDIDEWWQLTSDVAKAILKGWLDKISSNVPILFLTTTKTLYEELPEEVQDLFSKARGEIMTLCAPDKVTRRSFYEPLIIDASLRATIRPRERPKTPPPLAKAPTPPPTPMSEDQKRKLYEQEEHTLRELRIFLRDICKKLANNKLFFMFTKPVDTEEVPDYTTIIKQPMDLETMMTKVDFHRYECAKDFLADIELICQNALEYNPAKTSADKQIRHRACSLRDYAYTLIKTEMDTDFEDKCQNISVKRRARQYCPTKYLPPYINTIENAMIHKSPPELETTETVDKSSKPDEQKTTSLRKRKRWQRGMLMKKKRKTTSLPVEERGDLAFSEDNDESKEEVQADTKENERNGECSKSDTNVPLTINCDPPKPDAANEKSDFSLLSPRRRLGSLLSPSELLDYHLDFDDIEEAQNDAGNISESSPPVECEKAELETVLNNVIDITEDLSLEPLLDLYNNLSRIVKQYSTTHERSNLPKELSAELMKFKKALNIED